VKAQTLLAFDFGLKRIGVAVGQTLSRTATELDTVRASNGIPQWHHIDRLIRQWEPDTLVVGSPHSTHKNSVHKGIEKFGSDLVQRYNLPLLLVDESLTTEAANFELRGSELTTHKKQTMRDRVAARLILETHFNALKPNQKKAG
jgi:putative Holliday junction resolvase